MVIVELEAGDAIIQKHIIPVHTTLPAGNTPTAPAAPAAPAVGRPETGTKAKVTGAYACFLPTGGSTTTTSTTTETSHLPVGGKEIQLSDAQRVHVLDHARGKLFSLYPQLQPVSSTAATATQRERSQRVLEEQVVVGYAGGRKLSANCHKFSINPHVQINAVCEGFEVIIFYHRDVTCMANMCEASVSEHANYPVIVFQMHADSLLSSILSAVYSSCVDLSTYLSVSVSVSVSLSVCLCRISSCVDRTWALAEAWPATCRVGGWPLTVCWASLKKIYFLETILSLPCAEASSSERYEGDIL